MTRLQQRLTVLASVALAVTLVGLVNHLEWRAEQAAPRLIVLPPALQYPAVPPGRRPGMTDAAFPPPPPIPAAAD